jgi:hypothetical protein
MDQAASDYVLTVRVLHTGSIIMTHAVRYERRRLEHALAKDTRRSKAARCKVLKGWVDQRLDKEYLGRQDAIGFFSYPGYGTSLVSSM